MSNIAFFQMYGDTLENLEVITLDLIEDMLKEIKLSTKNGPLDVYPMIHRCTTGIISSIVSIYLLNQEA